MSYKPVSPVVNINLYLSVLDDRFVPVFNKNGDRDRGQVYISRKIKSLFQGTRSNVN